MTKQSYQRLLRIRYSHLRRNEISSVAAKALDEVLAMPHPQRELAFVAWPQSAATEAVLGSLVGVLVDKRG